MVTDWEWQQERDINWRENIDPLPPGHTQTRNLSRNHLWLLYVCWPAVEPAAFSYTGTMLQPTEQPCQGSHSSYFVFDG